MLTSNQLYEPDYWEEDASDNRMKWQQRKSLDKIWKFILWAVTGFSDNSLNARVGYVKGTHLLSHVTYPSKKEPIEQMGPVSIEASIKPPDKPVAKSRKI